MECKKFTNDDGSFHYKKHKIYLYKEDFVEFKDHLVDMIDYVIDAKGNEVISERHQKDYNPEDQHVNENSKSSSSYTDVNFEDI